MWREAWVLLLGAAVVGGIAITFEALKHAFNHLWLIPALLALWGLAVSLLAPALSLEMRGVQRGRRRIFPPGLDDRRTRRVGTAPRLR